MLQILTTQAFAGWFAALPDAAAEDVATALDVVEQLGPARAAPGSRESLLWYEHPSLSQIMRRGSLALAGDLEAWGALRDYTKQVVAKLESPRFAARLSRLAPADAKAVLSSVRAIQRIADPRLRWSLEVRGEYAHLGARGADDACDEVRRLFLGALEAAGFKATDVPAHSTALRELSRRSPERSFRLLYGVSCEREAALFVLGEWLDRSFYGDSVVRAERMWKAFLEGDRAGIEPAALR